MGYIEDAIASYDLEAAPFSYDGADTVVVNGQPVKIEWKRRELGSGTVNHGELRCHGFFEGHLITRPDGRHAIENTMGRVIGKLDLIVQYVLADHLVNAHQG